MHRSVLVMYSHARILYDITYSACFYIMYLVYLNDMYMKHIYICYIYIHLIIMQFTSTFFFSKISTIRLKSNDGCGRDLIL